MSIKEGYKEAGRGKETWKRVIGNGKKLKKLQIEQKKDQAAAESRGETPQTWKEFCAEIKSHQSTFPEYSLA